MRVAPAHHVRQPLQGGAITPVQIFQDEHQRAGGGEHLECLRELPQHAGGRYAVSDGLQALPVLGVSRAGRCTSQLGAYCRSTVTSGVPSGPRPRRPGPPAPGDRLLRSIVVETLAMPHPTSSVARPEQERLPPGRSCRSRALRRSSPPAGCPGVPVHHQGQLGQVRISPDEVRRTRREARRRGPGRPHAPSFLAETSRSRD